MEEQQAYHQCLECGSHVNLESQTYKLAVANKRISELETKLFHKTQDDQIIFDTDEYDFFDNDDDETEPVIPEPEECKAKSLTPIGADRRSIKKKYRKRRNHRADSGQSRKLTEQQIFQAATLVNSGIPISSIHELVGVNYKTLHIHLNRSEHLLPQFRIKHRKPKQ